jgi:ADP-ribose pyrophosphatase
MSPGLSHQTRPRHKAWEILRSREVYVAEPWVTLSVQQVRLPDGRVVDDYHQVRLPEYTVIFAETTDGQVLVERQYKHRVGGIPLMLPAGLLEPGEDPLQAAQRELMEETGYTATEWRRLGSFVPNANYGCGRAHLYHARNARRVAEADAGDLEDIEILLMPAEELLERLRCGQVHATSVVVLSTPQAMVAGLALAEKRRQKILLLEKPSLPTRLMPNSLAVPRLNQFDFDAVDRMLAEAVAGSSGP